MNSTSYYYIYSAMAQVMGALIALVGIFIVFRLQLQKDKIKECYENLRLQLSPKSIAMGQPTGGILFQTESELENSANNMIQNKSDERSPRVKTAYDFLKKHKEILQYVKTKGVHIIFELGFIFIYYIFILHFNESIFSLGYMKFFFYVGLIFTVVINFRVLCFLKRCIAPFPKEPLT